MHRKRLYPIAKSAANICQYLSLSPERVLRRAGLPIDLFANEGKGVEAHDYLALWEAIWAEVDDPEMIFKTAIAYARGPFAPPLFAFSCSPNITEGLTRLAKFKALVGPLKIEINKKAESLTFSIVPIDERMTVPDKVTLWELVFFVECCRTFSGAHIQPLAVSGPHTPTDLGRYEDYFGVALGTAKHPTITLSNEDALRPLISENEALWEQFEQHLQKQLLEGEETALLSMRVRNTLLELLPAGKSGADDVCERLKIGRRTLQRQLKSENKTYQQILDETRSELSLHYLKKHDISIEEISYLLAFKEPNSFYRAFQSWTGMTPMEARNQSVH